MIKVVAYLPKRRGLNDKVDDMATTSETPFCSRIWDIKVLEVAGYSFYKAIIGVGVIEFEEPNVVKDLILAQDMVDDHSLWNRRGIGA